MNHRTMRVATTVALLLAPVLLRAQEPPGRNPVALKILKEVDIREVLSREYPTDDTRRALGRSIVARGNVTLAVAIREDIEVLPIVPDGIEYDYADEQVKLTWRYTSSRPLTAAQERAVARELGKVLYSLVRQPDLVNEQDARMLQRELTVRRVESGSGGPAPSGSGSGDTRPPGPGGAPGACCCQVWYVPVWSYWPCGCGAYWYAPYWYYPAALPYYYAPVPAGVAVWTAPGPAFAPAYAPVQWTARTRPDPREPAPIAAERVVPRTELLKGKTERDWAALYDAGYRHYWAGRYAQAVEYCAAAAQLKDDARAWYYLSFALRALGETDAARDAVKYAAALAFVNRDQKHLVIEALKDVQGRARDELTQIQVAVENDRAAGAALAARPQLNTRPTTVATGAPR
jgi:hypothetical protein